MSAAQGNLTAQSVVKSLEKFRNEESFDLFWQLLDKQRERIEVSDPSLPRKRKIPKRLEDCFGYGTSDTSYFLDTAKSHYRCIYLQSVSWILAEFCYNRSPQGPSTGTCTILQETINGFLCPLIVFRKM